MRSFSSNINDFIKKTGVKGTLVVKKLAFDALRGVMMRSPVDTGRFRASWRIAMTEPDLTVEPPHEGEGVMQPNVKASLPGLKWGMTVWITNNIVYGPPLEQGHSKQAPNGVLGPTFAELVASFDRVVRAIK